MPSVHVSLPAALKSRSLPPVLDCEAGTVAEALRAAVTQAPRFAQRILCGDRLLITMALNGHRDASPDVTANPLAAGDRVDVLPPVGGG